MAASVRTFFRRLSPEAIGSVLAVIGAEPIDLDGLSAAKSAAVASNAALDGDGRRGLIEAIVSEIAALSTKPDLAELALRAVCEDQPALLSMLDDSLSLDERCWRVWSCDSKLIDRARNVAMKHHWQDGRFHCGFSVTNPGGLKHDLASAVSVIQEYIQNREGGRRAESDLFTYRDPETKTDEPSLIHHVAIYLERPARYLMEFGGDDAGVQPVIRHEARELAITYSERTGQIDVAGYGVGGLRVLRDIAETFHAEAVENSTLEVLTRKDWVFDCFQTMAAPVFKPPEGFDSVRIIELRLRSREDAMHRATFKTDASTSVYDRLAQLGVGHRALGLEFVAGVVLTLRTFPGEEEQKQRDVRIKLDWPAGLKFDNATIAEQRALEAWLDLQPFATRST
jgi:hypothetical protein